MRYTRARSLSKVREEREKDETQPREFVNVQDAKLDEHNGNKFCTPQSTAARIETARCDSKMDGLVWAEDGERQRNRNRRRAKTRRGCRKCCDQTSLPDEMPPPAARRKAPSMSAGPPWSTGDGGVEILQK